MVVWGLSTGLICFQIRLPLGSRFSDVFSLFFIHFQHPTGAHVSWREKDGKRNQLFVHYHMPTWITWSSLCDSLFTGDLDILILSPMFHTRPLFFYPAKGNVIANINKPECFGFFSTLPDGCVIRAFSSVDTAPNRALRWNYATLRRWEGNIKTLSAPILRFLNSKVTRQQISYK